MKKQKKPEKKKEKKIIHPWDKQPKESQKAYAAFVRYRDAGPKRSHRTVAKSSPERRQFSRWSTRYNWLKRVEKWEEHLDKKKQEAMEGFAEEMAKRQIDLGKMLQSASIQGRLNLDTTKMKAMDVAKLAEIGVKIERLASGADTEKVGLKHDVSALDVMKELKEITDKMPSIDEEYDDDEEEEDKQSGSK